MLSQVMLSQFPIHPFRKMLSGSPKALELILDLAFMQNGLHHIEDLISITRHLRKENRYTGYTSWTSIYKSGSMIYDTLLQQSSTYANSWTAPALP